MRLRLVLEVTICQTTAKVKNSTAATDEEQDVSKRKRAKNWLPEEETTLVDGYMENKEELTCELKGCIKYYWEKYG